MLNRILNNAETIAIGGHIRPDGDCVGSCMGLYHYIRDNYKDKKVDVYLEELPDKFCFLKSTEVIRHKIPKDKVYDLFISLDCGDKERLGFSVPLFDRARRTYCIDHHVSNTGFAQNDFTEPDASSTRELVYQFMDEDKISLAAAEALYLGIVHDTGVFQYTSAAPSTFRMAANLLEKGVNGAKLVQDTYYEKTYAQNQILGRTLLESILFMDKTCIASYVTKKTMDFYGVGVKDLDGIVSQLRVTKDVEVAIFMYEIETNVYKVSLRSKEKVDVSKVARYFGGGGHKKAAGLTMAGTYYDVLNNLSAQIEAQMEEQK